MLKERTNIESHLITDTELSENDRLILGTLFSPDNPSQVITYYHLSQIMPYYSLDGVNSMLHRLNGKLQERGVTEWRIAGGDAGPYQRGFGVLTEVEEFECGKEELCIRLEEKLRQEIIQASRQNVQNDQVDNITYFYPSLDLGMYPHIFPVVVGDRSSHHHIWFLTENERYVVKALTENEGYIDPIIWRNKTGKGIKLSHYSDFINHHAYPGFISGTWPAGYAIDGRKELRNRYIRRQIVSMAKKPGFRRNLVDTNSYWSETRGHTSLGAIHITIVKAKDLFGATGHHQPPYQINTQFPYLLIIERCDLDNKNEAALVVAEIGESHREILQLEGASLIVDTSTLPILEREKLAKRYKKLFSQMRSVGIEFEEDTGIATTTKAVLPVPLVKL